MRGATRTQFKLMQAIEEMSENGIHPTLRELAAHFGWSSVYTVWCHVRRLEAKGFATFAPGKTRTLKLTIDGLETIGARRRVTKRVVPIPPLRCSCGATRFSEGICPQCGADVKASFGALERA